jgi:pimeloyl-ACP methyl ester carboxylesterase
LYLHGSALNIGSNINHVRRFRNLGFSVFIVSYRGYGKSDGSFPTEEQIYADAEAAWRYMVDQRGIDPGEIFIYGHSLGGAVAIHLAVNHPDARGLIVEATFTSMLDMGRMRSKYRIFPLEILVNQRFDSLSKIGRNQVPVLFLHGTADSLVPHEMSRRLYERATAPKKLKLILQGGHNNSAAIGGQEYLQTVREFVEFTAKNPENSDRLVLHLGND